MVDVPVEANAFQTVGSSSSDRALRVTRWKSCCCSGRYVQTAERDWPRRTPSQSIPIHLGFHVPEVVVLSMLQQPTISLVPEVMKKFADQRMQTVRNTWWKPRMACVKNRL